MQPILFLRQIGDEFTSSQSHDNHPLLRVRAFGTLSIFSPVGSLGPRDLGGVKTKQLFELLLLSRRTSLSKTALADALWDTTFPQNVSATLENYVSKIRHHLFASSAAARDVIVTEHDAYRLAAEFVACDLDEFDNVLAQAGATTQAEEAIQFFDQAQHLATGELLEDEPNSPWVLAWRSHYRRRVIDMHLSAAEVAMRIGRFAVAEDHAERVLAMESLNERAVRVAMHAATELGCQHRALALYERCRGDLAEKLGIYPSEQTRLLQSLIVRQQPLPLASEPWASDFVTKEKRTISEPYRSSNDFSAPNTRTTESAVPQSNEDSTLMLLFGACALAQRREGRSGVLRLLSEASSIHHRIQKQLLYDAGADIPVAFGDDGLDEFLDLVQSFGASVGP